LELKWELVLEDMIYVFSLIINPSCYKGLWNKVDKIHSISKDLLQSAKNQGLPSNIECVIINPAINTNYFRRKEKK